MSELVIKTHNFELAKKGLKEFLQKTEEDLKYDDVSKKGFLGLGAHKVTGEELNERIKFITNILIDLNNTNIKTIKEFGQVYNALEALDKDYIQAILISIKATEKTSERIQATQEQIKKIVDDQKKTLEVLKKFKQKLDGYAHLEDIDKIWNNCQKLYDSLINISNELSFTKDTTYKQHSDIETLLAFMDTLTSYEHLNDIDDIWNKNEEHHLKLDELVKTSKAIQSNVASNAENIEELQAYKNHLGQIKHLDNVDTLWEKTEMHSGKLDGLAQQNVHTLEFVRASQISIEELTAYKEKLCSVTHLNDVDDIWNSNELHASQLSELKKQSDDTKSIVKLNKANTDAAIASVVEKNDTLVQMLTKKIKYAYLLAGGSLGLAVIALIVILLRVI